MKKLITAAALLTAASINAEELKFGDLNYFIPVGQFNLVAQVDYVSNEEKVDTTTNEVEGYFNSAQLTWGLADRLNLYATLRYQWDVEVTDETNSAVKTYNQDGLANPEIGGVYRLVTQDNASVNLDVGASVSFGIQDAEVGDANTVSSNDGNAVNGRNALSLYLQTGRKWNEANEWQVRAGLVHNFDGEHEVQTAGGPDSDVDVDSSTDYYLSAAYQYRPVHEFMMSVTALATLYGEVESKSSGVHSQLDSHVDYDFIFSAKYLVTSNLLLNFTYSQSRNPKYEGSVSGTDYKIDDRFESRIGLGASWLF